MGPLILETSIDAPLELVWKAWTETKRITEWFSPAANIVPEKGGAYELFFDPADHSHMSTIGCIVTAIKPMELLAFTWKGPDQFAEFMNEPQSTTSVEVIFREEEGRTHIRVEHRGWGTDAGWAKARDWHLKAWEGVLSSLESGFESGEGILCCDP
jgi:uncharacterized protein YndB with AHSA1/START domain